MLFSRKLCILLIFNHFTTLLLIKFEFSGKNEKHVEKHMFFEKHVFSKEMT
jgi:hypothetical protein